MLMCPKCGSDKVEQYRSPTGPMWCNNKACGYRIEYKEKNNPFVVKDYIVVYKEDWSSVNGVTKDNYTLQYIEGYDHPSLPDSEDPQLFIQKGDIDICTIYVADTDKEHITNVLFQFGFKIKHEDKKEPIKCATFVELKQALAGRDLMFAVVTLADGTIIPREELLSKYNVELITGEIVE